MAAVSVQYFLASSKVNGVMLIMETNFSTVDAAKLLSRSSFLTPSAPILSNLSKVMHTLSASASVKPAAKIKFFKMRRSLMRILKFSMPMFNNAFAVVSISSTSQLVEEEPKISISHCTNSRRRPFCGRSARNTRSIWITLNGVLKLLRLQA